MKKLLDGCLHTLEHGNAYHFRDIFSQIKGHDVLYQAVPLTLGEGFLQYANSVKTVSNIQWRLIASDIDRWSDFIIECKTWLLLLFCSDTRAVLFNGSPRTDIGWIGKNRDECEELILTIRARHDRDSNQGFHGCEPNALPPSYLPPICDVWGSVSLTSLRTKAVFFLRLESSLEKTDSSGLYSTTRNLHQSKPPNTPNSASGDAQSLNHPTTRDVHMSSKTNAIGCLSLPPPSCHQHLYA